MSALPLLLLLMWQLMQYRRAVIDLENSNRWDRARRARSLAEYYGEPLPPPEIEFEPSFQGAGNPPIAAWIALFLIVVGMPAITIWGSI